MHGREAILPKDVSRKVLQGSPLLVGSAVYSLFNQNVAGQSNIT